MGFKLSIYYSPFNTKSNLYLHIELGTAFILLCISEVAAWLGSNKIEEQTRHQRITFAVHTFGWLTSIWCNSHFCCCCVVLGRSEKLHCRNHWKSKLEMFAGVMWGWMSFDMKAMWENACLFLLTVFISAMNRFVFQEKEAHI